MEAQVTDTEVKIVRITPRGLPTKGAGRTWHAPITYHMEDGTSHDAHYGPCSTKKAAAFGGRERDVHNMTALLEDGRFWGVRERYF